MRPFGPHTRVEFFCSKMSLLHQGDIPKGSDSLIGFFERSVGVTQISISFQTSGSQGLGPRAVVL